MIAINLVVSVVYGCSREQLASWEKYPRRLLLGGSCSTGQSPWLLLPFMQFHEEANFYEPADLSTDCWVSHNYHQKKHGDYSECISLYSYYPSSNGLSLIMTGFSTTQQPGNPLVEGEQGSEEPVRLF